MSNRGFLAVLAAIAFVGLLAFGLIAKEGDAVEVGQPAPDAPVELLDGTGEASLADFRGKWVLLNFWASWCKPCREEAPAIERYSREHAGEVAVVGIAVKDSTDAATEFAEELDLTYELWRDGAGERMDAYGIVALPESYLVDPDGNLALIHRGPVDEEIMEETVTPLVEGTAGS
jgi:cytochrome c biogenesis protein CcmG/thiol:disulfide interchange protein DsbE